jgi:LytS/YehU family sensor histidine kinase
VLVFLFYSFDRHQPNIELHQVIFFLNYAGAACLINYVLLPRFLYQNKQLEFFGYTALVILGVIMIEELVLEKIYFPDTRGKNFPGIFLTLLGILPVITILSGFKFAWDALRKQREVEELKGAMAESELQFLASQINPHFLFNNLNNLYAYAIEDSPRTPEIILELSSVLRYMLYECKSTYVPLSKEIAHLEHFTKLNQLQIEERGTVNFHTHNLQGGFQIAPLILIVFIENAFKHSQSSQSDHIEIEIGIEVSEQGQLDFFCENTFQKQANTEHLPHGIGLQNVQKRLKLLYPHAHQLDIRETEDQYSVHLSLQLTSAHA